MPRKTSVPPLMSSCPDTASMRPRPDAAENPGLSSGAPRSPPCFNEAAARCRGKHGFGRSDGAQPAGASMRPRPDAAENAAFIDYVFRAGGGLQ